MVMVPCTLGSTTMFKPMLSPIQRKKSTMGTSTTSMEIGSPLKLDFSSVSSEIIPAFRVFSTLAAMIFTPSAGLASGRGTTATDFGTSGAFGLMTGSGIRMIPLLVPSVISGRRAAGLDSAISMGTDFSSRCLADGAAMAN